MNAAAQKIWLEAAVDFLGIAPPLVRRPIVTTTTIVVVAIRTTQESN